MGDIEDFHDAFYRDLASLQDDAFPKRCAGCGQVYDDITAFLRGTVPVAGGGLKGVTDMDTHLVELYRNCACGSTLLEFCADRRDQSERGRRRREKFGRLLDSLVAAGVERNRARAAILKSMSGQRLDLAALLQGQAAGDQGGR